MIRPWSMADRGGVRHVLLASFDRPVVSDLAELLEDRVEGWSFVAVEDDEVVGYSRISRSWVDAPERLVEVMVVSPVGVLPTHQGRGIGGDLIRAVLQAAQDEGEPLVFLEGSPDFYGRFGFVAGGGMGFTAPSVRIPPAAFQVVALPSYQPWMTGALVYCEPFWALDCVGLREGQLGDRPVGGHPVDNDERPGLQDGRDG